MLRERQERILLSLKKLDFLSREQLRIMHNLGKVRNANRILKELSPYLSNYRDEKTTIYYLNKLGREYVNSKKVRRKNSFVNHVLLRNDFYIFVGYPTEWKNEMRVRDEKNAVICDAWFKKDGKYQFLEVDRMQKMKENKSKIKQYKGLFENEGLVNHFGYFPKINWVTTTELRRKQLKELCDGLPCEVYTINDIK